MRNIPPFGVVLAASFGLFACGAPHDNKELRCVSRASQAIYAGYGDPRAAGLSTQASWAIGAIENDVGALYGTGVVIHPRWLLTAAHIAVADARLRLAAGHAPRVSSALGKAVRHPKLDLALIEVLEPESIEASGLEPLALRTARLDQSLVGTQAVLAGVGLTEQGDWGKLEFVEEPIVALEARMIRVDGRGSSGACSGDSGGPLIARRSDGAPEVLGILSAGAMSCRGIDVYTRIDLETEWIQKTTGFSPDPCASSYEY